MLNFAEDRLQLLQILSNICTI